MRRPEPWERAIASGSHLPAASRGSTRNPRFPVFACRDGKVVCFASHLDSNRALEPAGYEE